MRTKTANLYPPRNQTWYVIYYCNELTSTTRVLISIMIRYTVFLFLQQMEKQWYCRIAPTRFLNTRTKVNRKLPLLSKQC